MQSRAAQCGSIVLVAHGSRDPSWRLPFDQVAARLSEQLHKRVVLGFLELAEPTFEQTLAEALEQSTSIAVVPLFWSLGAHTRSDLPRRVSEFAAAHPQATIECFQHIGALESFRDATVRILADLLEG
jgi:sirohydrochlorin cobaltochelatase